MQSDDDLMSRIRVAVEQGVDARAKYFQSIDLADEQALGSPASIDKVDLLESDLGRPLPPSYRQFLLMFDGWHMIDGGVDLLPVDDLLGGARHQAVLDWQTQMLSEGDEVAARSLVIGVSSITPTKYLLDPTSIDEAGEWQLIQHHHGEEAVVPSFFIWLEESVNEYLELAATN